MKLKPGVNITGIRPEMIVALLASEGVYRALNTDLVVTSCLDGKHAPTSLHYAGAAVDLRTRDFESPAVAQKARDMIAEALGQDFDVVLEADHIHLESQARYRGTRG